MRNITSFENHATLGWAIAFGLALDAEFIERGSKGDNHIIKQCIYVHVGPENTTMGCWSLCKPNTAKWCYGHGKGGAKTQSANTNGWKYKIYEKRSQWMNVYFLAPTAFPPKGSIPTHVPAMATPPPAIATPQQQQRQPTQQSISLKPTCGARRMVATSSDYWVLVAFAIFHVTALNTGWNNNKQIIMLWGLRSLRICRRGIFE